MGRRRTETLLVTPVVDTGGGRIPVEVLVEAPLAIELDGVRVATTQRTPGHDFELAVGWCVSEGLLDDAPVRDVRYCATGSALETGFNVVTVSSSPGRATVLSRSSRPSSGHWRTASVEEIVAALQPLEPSIATALPPAALAAWVPLGMAQVAERATTGAGYGAVALDGQGRVVVAREDVDQANAIDKVIGRLVLDGAWPASGLALFISGRPTASVVHQVWRAGCGALVALGAPTAQAVHLARTGGLTLLSAPGDHGPVVYAPERLGAGVPVRSTDA